MNEWINVELIVKRQRVNHTVKLVVNRDVQAKDKEECAMM